MGGRMSSEVECTSTNEVKEKLVWEGVPETEGGGITNVHQACGQQGLTEPTPRRMWVS